MNNIKKFALVLLVLVPMLPTAFAYAQYDYGGYDYGGYDTGDSYDYGGYDSSSPSYSDYGGYDSSSYPSYDYGGYDYSTSPTYSDYGGYDTGSSYSDYPSTDCSSCSTASYSDYPSYSYSDYPSSTDCSSCSTTYSDYPTYSYSDYPTSDTYSDYPSTNCTSCSTTYSDYPTTDTYSDYPSYDCSSCWTGGNYGYEGGYSYTGGGYGYTPPVVIPQQPIAIGGGWSYGGGTTVIPVSLGTPTTNNVVNNNINTNVNKNINTNVNTNTNVNVIPTPAPVQYNVQYVAPTPIYQPTPVYPQYQNLYCSISAAPAAITAGQYTYLTWSSSGGVSYATLSGVGTVGPNGSWSIHPTASSNYVLTVYGANGQSATCNTYVTINGVQPYVTLSQIPYTGFDFGPMGDAMYWAVLLAFALSAAYLVIYYKGGAFAFAGSMVNMPKFRRSRTSAPKAAPVAKAVASAPAPVIRGEAVVELPTHSSRHTVDAMSIDKSGSMPRLVISRE